MGSLLSRKQHTLAVLALLCAFLLRAVIPAGYMPSQGADSDKAGLAGMTLCVSGLPLPVVTALGLLGQDDHAEPLMLHCAFGSVSSQAFLLFAVLGLILVLGYSSWLPRRVVDAGSEPMIHGPPVGSRAPPSWSSLARH